MSDSTYSPALLFVDDEPGILSSLRRLFRPQGYRIYIAESGAAGLEILAKESIDLVISDMRMPEMDGATFLKEVRSRWPKVMRILLTGYADITSTVAAINHGEIYRYIAKPWDDNEIVTIVREALERMHLEKENQRLSALTLAQNDELKALNTSLEQKVAERTAELRQALAFVEQSHGELKKSFLTSVQVFAGVIELRSGSVGSQMSGHGRRVAEHARSVAQRMGLSDNEVQNVMLAGLLHDIGKLGLPDELLSKPFNTLTGEQRALVMKHPLIGQNILMGIEKFKEAAVLVRHHHECYDGSGYPDHLTGIAIPQGAVSCKWSMSMIRCR
jgi:response regulator RpfG family c-di-GMP phosphodiesterase